VERGVEEKGGKGRGSGTPTFREKVTPPRGTRSPQLRGSWGPSVLIRSLSTFAAVFVTFRSTALEVKFKGETEKTAGN